MHFISRDFLCEYQQFEVCLSISKNILFMYVCMLGLFCCYLMKLPKHLSLHEYLIHLILMKSFSKQIHETHAFDFLFCAIT